MSEAPFMPKATAVWLVTNTTLSFKQIANFCNLHELEVKGIADGDVAKGIKAYNPILAGQLTREEIDLSSKDQNRPLNLTKKNQEVVVSKERKKARYTPLSKRKDRPDSVLWLVKNFSQLSDGQIAKMVGSTKGTVGLIRNRSYWNLSSLTAKDPVILGLCSQLQFEKAVEKADRRVKREKKLKEKEQKLKEKEQNLNKEESSNEVN
ncbi:MAG: cytoplasmic protein [Candidatus Pelagibacter sp.]|nr:cytoplasmic protein [Candidatus Pelagibacter sp.]|tara:strand:- start:163 stop:783 length:621 start_codon:yes stop_codon:yes gene_type:complete